MRMSMFVIVCVIGGSMATASDLSVVDEVAGPDGILAMSGKAVEPPTMPTSKTGRSQTTRQSRTVPVGGSSRATTPSTDLFNRFPIRFNSRTHER